MESQSRAVSRWAGEALGEGEVFRRVCRVGRGAAPVNGLGPAYFSGLSVLSHWFFLSLSFLLLLHPPPFFSQLRTPAQKWLMYVLLACLLKCICILKLA